MKFKAKDSEIVAKPVCLRNISKDWPAVNNGYVYEFGVDYRAFNPANIDKIAPIINGYFKVKYGII